MARRGDPTKPNALVAAATKIRLSEPDVAKLQQAAAPKWQSEAWAYFDEVPEIKEAVRYRGNQLAKLRLFVAVANPTDVSAEPVPASDPDSGVPPEVAAAAGAELARLRSLEGGQPEIMRMLDMNMEVPGECYLVGWGATTEQVQQTDGTTVTVPVPEDWQIRSVAEVEVKNDGTYAVRAKQGDTKPKALTPARDDIMRIWTRHPQWRDQPDSAMRALLGECRTLQVLSQQVLAQAMRAVSAGFFTVPNELSFGPADPTQDTAAEGAELADPLNQALNDVLIRPIDDPSDPSSVQPGVFRGPAEYLQPQYLRRISFYDPAIDTVLEAKIEARVTRIARGLNLPVEVVMGLRQTTYANAAQIDEDEFNDYLAPSADLAVDALTYAFLTPQLAENPAVPPEWADGRLFVWYDPADLIAQPDTEKNADEALQRGTISEAAYRRVKGFGDDDAPEPLERLQRAGLTRGILTADLTLALLKLLDVPIDVEESVGELVAPPPEDSPDGEQMVDAETRTQLLQLLAGSVKRGSMKHGSGSVTLRGPVDSELVAAWLQAQNSPVIEASARRQSDAGRRLTDLDRELRTRLSVAANDAMDRALERAGNRLRSKTNGSPLRATLGKVPTRSVFAHLGSTLVAQVLGDDDVLDGAWDALEAQFMEWGAQAQAQAIDIAGQVTAGFTTAQRSTLQLRQADDLADAWAWMRGALDNLAGVRMFDPDPAMPDLGEFDPSLRVPTGLVRQAIARAGGATGLTAQDGGGAWITLTDAGTRPAGGIGTGELVRGALRDGGASIEGFVWEYGPAFRRRPFDPHVQLDGTVFQNFDDDVLANSDGWPEFAFFMPGDHAGCSCDASPVIIPAEDLE